MSTLSKRPAALRDTWRLPDRPLGYVRHLRRWLVTLLALCLLAALTYLLWAPFWHPNFHLLLLTADGYAVSTIPPVKWATRDLAGFESLKPVIIPSRDDPTSSLRVIRSRQSFQESLQDVTVGQVQTGDVVIVYISAHGVAMDGEPYLLCKDFDPVRPQDGRFPITRLLEQVSQSPATVKLIVLDSGRVTYDAPLGILVNDFPVLLEEMVAKTGPDVWVLNSNSANETVHVSRGMRESVFGHFLARGLTGEADLDGDQFIRLDELYQFVSSHVLAWSDRDTGSSSLQTPLLLRGGGADPFGEPPILLSATKLPTVGEVLELADDLTAEDAAGGPASAADAGASESNGAGKEMTPADGAEDPPSVTAHVSLAMLPAEDFSPTLRVDSIIGEMDTNLPVEPAEPPSEDRLRIEDAWELVEFVHRRRMAEPNPLDYAPHLWRELLQQIHGYAVRLYDTSQPNSPDEVQWNQEFEQLVKALRAFVRPETTSPSLRVSHPTVERIRDYRIPLEMNTEELRTLGLRERIARVGPVLSADEQALIGKLDELTTANSRAPLDSWIEESWDPAFDRFLELRVLHQLANQPGLDWPTMRLILQAVRRGEQVAAEPLCLVPWIRDRVDNGDQLRRAGIRAILDDIGVDAGVLGRRRLTRSLRQYDLAEREADTLRQSIQLRNTLLLRLRDYVHLQQVRGSAAVGPPQEDIVSLAQSAADVCAALDAVEQTSASELARLTKRALELVQQLENDLLRTATLSLALVPDEDASLATAYLMSAIPTADVRRRLLPALSQRVDTPALTLSGQHRPASSASLSPLDWKTALRQAEIELAVAGMVKLHPADDEGAYALLAKACAECAEANTSAQPAAQRRISTLLSRLYRTLPGRIENAIAGSRDLSDITRREENLARLRAVERSLHLLDPRYDRGASAREGLATLQNARWYDLLVWHRDRFLAAQKDAPSGELSFAREAASRYRLLANAVPQQPVVTAADIPVLRLDGPTSISLVNRPEVELRFALSYRGSGDAPTWILVQYDPQLLEVSSSVPNVLPEFEIAERLSARVAEAQAQLQTLRATPQFDPQRAESLSNVIRSIQYPYAPDLAGMPSTFVLRPGEQRGISLTVRAVSNSAPPTRLIFKTITQSQYLRHEVQLGLPGRGSFILEPTNDPVYWSARDDGLVLHPTPGHDTNYRFTLANNTTVGAPLSVQLFALGSSIGDTVLPRRPLSPADLDEALTQLPPLTKLREIAEVQLRGDGEATPLRFETAEEGAPAASEEETPPGISIRHGMLLVATESDSKQTTLWRIDFRPRRPRSYLQALVDYDTNRERLTVRVKPLEGARVPADGFRIECDFAVPLPRGTQARLEDVITPSKREAVLYADVAVSAAREEWLYLHVDDYPRAFVFRVPLWVSARGVPPVRNLSRIQILEPTAGAAYSDAATTIESSFQVDAPVGAFDGGVGSVQIGIDADRDREFRDDTTVQILSDRQAEVWLTPGGDPGLTLRADVGDFRIHVPVRTVQNARVNLLANLQVGQQVFWSEPVELVVDHTGPSIDRVQLRPDRLIVQDSELEVRVWVGDDSLSGVAQVQVGFDLAGSGKLSEGNTPIDAARDASGVWTAMVPAAAPPGPATLLVEATDQVDNKGEGDPIDVRIVTQQQLDEIEAEATNRVLGQLFYADMPLVAADVELVGDSEVDPVVSNDEGRFTFPAVKPGKYTLKARGIARNKPRFVEEEIEVLPGPAHPLRLRLDAK